MDQAYRGDSRHRGPVTRTAVGDGDRETASRMIVATLASALATGLRTGATDMKVVEPYLEAMAEAGRPAGLQPKLAEIADLWGREKLADRDVEQEMRWIAKELSPGTASRGPSGPDVAAAGMAKAGAER